MTVKNSILVVFKMIMGYIFLKNIELEHLMLKS